MSGERQYNNTYGPMDAELQLEDGAAAITADGAGSAIIDLGDDGHDDVAGHGSYVRGDVVINVEDFDFTTEDERVDVKVQLSTSPTFASGIATRAVLPLGDAVAPDDVNKIALGRYTIPVDNEIGTTRYRYMRLWFDVSGDTPSITCKAWFAKAPHVESN